VTSDGRRGGQVTVAAIDLPPGASFPAPPAGNPAAGTFTWTPEPGQEGSYVVVFTATSASGFSAVPLSVTVTVVEGDQTPPDLSVTVHPQVLWPPNHRLVRLGIDLAVADDQDPAPRVELVSVESSEPDDAPGGGDGHTTGDIVIEGPTAVSVRAERSAHGPGRVYTLTYRARDAAGNETVATATVTVPHSRSH
jgi:hypothetical protein